jgi:hypothetical protein
MNVQSRTFHLQSPPPLRQKQRHVRCNNYDGGGVFGRNIPYRDNMGPYRGNNDYHRYNDHRYNYPVHSNVFYNRRRLPSFNRRSMGPWRYPRPIRLNDFMPQNLQEEGSSSRFSLPTDFHHVSPRQQNNNNNNTTQPFQATNPVDSRSYQRKEGLKRTQFIKPTTSAFRRRQQRQDTNNRFAPLADDNENPSSDVEFDGDTDNDNGQEIHPTMERAYPSSKKKRKNKTWKQQSRVYLDTNRILRYLQDNAPATISGRGNQAYALAATPIYDEWVRCNYDLQVWQTYLKIGTEENHWAKEVVTRSKKRDNINCTQFVQKKINQLTSKMTQASARISELQIELGVYWTQTTAPTTTTTSTTNRPRDSIDRIEKAILKYIHHCTQHAKKMAEIKLQLVKVQKDEYKALKHFEPIATPFQNNIHLVMKSKMKQWATKYKNYRLALKQVEYDSPPEFIGKVQLSFRINESILNRDEVESMYNRMRQITKEYRTQSMALYLQALNREQEVLSTDIKRMLLGFSTRE